MKTCGTCKVEKDIAEFSANASKKDGLQSKCKECTNSYNKEWYGNNADLQKSRVAAHKIKYRQYMYDVLSEATCADCPEDRIAALQFDHDDPKDKKFCVSLGRGLTSIKAEIAKCTIRCANCHAVRTAEQFGWYNKLEIRAGGRSAS